METNKKRKNLRLQINFKNRLFCVFIILFGLVLFGVVVYIWDIDLLHNLNKLSSNSSEIEENPITFFSIFGVGVEATLQGKENYSGVTERVYTVSGSSMSPLFISGDSVTALEDYYKYNSVKREDIVIHRYSPDENPIMKTIKGIAGDTLALQQIINKDTGVGKEAWNIIINSKALTNSQNQKYEISMEGYKRLSLYINDYNGIIPEGTVLLMGEQSYGSFDATKIGLTAVSDLVGKVIVNPEEKLEVDNHLATKAYVDAGSDLKSEYMGTTTITYTGDLGEFIGANAKCQANYSGSHFCSVREIIQSGRTSGMSTAWVRLEKLSVTNESDFSKPLYADGLTYGGAGGTHGECVAWGSTSSSIVGLAMASTELPTMYACNTYLPIHCCK